MPAPAAFQKVIAFVDVRAALAELARQPELWGEITLRQDYPGSAHHDTECIFLRGPSSATGAFTEIPAYPYPALDKLPACGTLVCQVMEKLNATELGRVMVVNLKAGGHIDRHIDEGAYAAHYQRFHVVLASEPGNSFRCGASNVWMAPGTVWWFDHHQEHEVDNLSTHGRIHLIVDLVSKAWNEGRLALQPFTERRVRATS